MRGSRGHTETAPGEGPVRHLSGTPSSQGAAAGRVGLPHPTAGTPVSSAYPPFCENVYTGKDLSDSIQIPTQLKQEQSTHAVQTVPLNVNFTFCETI